MCQLMTKQSLEERKSWMLLFSRFWCVLYICLNRLIPLILIIVYKLNVGTERTGSGSRTLRNAKIVKGPII